MQPLEIKARDGLTLCQLPDAAAGHRPRRRRQARQAGADGAQRPRRTVGPRRLGLRPRAPVARQPRLRGAGVNYRGSTGFGKKFVNAGNNEWAGKMHDDLIDAVELGRRRRRSPTRTRSPSWAAATAATPRSSA